MPAARSRARPHLSWAFPVVPQRAIRPIPQQAPTADILDPGKTVSGAFTFGAHTYMPMIRVVVGVTWDDNMHQAKTCLYTTSELLDIGVDNKLII